MSDMQVDLSATAGFPVALDRRTGALRFGGTVATEASAARRLDDLGNVLRDPGLQGSGLVYHLYRGVRCVSDDPLLTGMRLRYDLTVTMPGSFGSEYPKTAGHYHPPGDEGVSFPEVYEVVYGRAAFVLQHADDITVDRPWIDEVWMQVCEVGERIIIPPDCGHVTVNIGSDPLVVADLISVRCGHLYGSFQELRGAAYYVLADAEAQARLRLEPNPTYRQLPEPSIARGSRWEPFLQGEQPIYTHLQVEPKDFEFLDSPEGSRGPLLELWRESGTSPSQRGAS